MAITWRSLWNEKVLYPAGAVALLGTIVGLQYCPMARPMAQDFTLPVVTEGGRAGPDRMSLGNLRGKVVLLDFWATWCRPCAITTPSLVRLSHRFRARGLVVIGVNVDQDGPDAVPYFVRRYGVDYPVVYDDGNVSQRYNVRGLPTVVLIDRTGHIRRVHTGIAGEQELASQIEELL